jgi:hypothetical protein
MSDVIVSKSATWDSKIGNFITTTTLENLTAFPAIPAGAIDVTKSVEGGTYRVSYKDNGDTTGAGGAPGSSSSYNYECHTSVSTEPLLTFGSFQSGGAWALSDDDKTKIKEAEADPTKWKDHAAGTGGLAQYATFILAGIESFYAPTVTLTITDDESSVPALSDLGKIASGLSNAPTLPSGGDWLFSGCNFSALQNGKWRISREYRASGKGGWESELYG